MELPTCIDIQNNKNWWRAGNLWTGYRKGLHGMQKHLEDTRRNNITGDRFDQTTSWQSANCKAADSQVKSRFRQLCLTFCSSTDARPWRLWEASRQRQWSFHFKALPVCGFVCYERHRYHGLMDHGCPWQFDAIWSYLIFALKSFFCAAHHRWRPHLERCWIAECSCKKPTTWCDSLFKWLHFLVRVAHAFCCRCLALMSACNEVTVKPSWKCPRRLRDSGIKDRERERERARKDLTEKDLHEGFPSLCRSTIHWAPLSQILSYLNQIAASWTDAANCRGKSATTVPGFQFCKKTCTLSYLAWESRRCFPGMFVHFMGSCELCDFHVQQVAACFLAQCWRNDESVIRWISSVPFATQWFHEHRIKACRHFES